MLSFLFPLLHSGELYSSKKANTKSNRNPVLPLDFSFSKANTQSCAERSSILMLLLLSCSWGRRESLRGLNMLAEKTHRFRRPRSAFLDCSRSLNQNSSSERHLQYIQGSAAEKQNIPAEGPLHFGGTSAGSNILARSSPDHLLP